MFLLAYRHFTRHALPSCLWNLRISDNDHRFAGKWRANVFDSMCQHFFPIPIPGSLRKIGRESTKSDDLSFTIVFKKRARISGEGYWKASRQNWSWSPLPPGTEMLCMSNELSDLRLTFDLFSTWFILNPSTITWVDWKHKSSKNRTVLHCTGNDLIDLSSAIPVSCGWNLSVQKRGTGYQCMDLTCTAFSHIQWPLLSLAIPAIPAQADKHPSKSA